MRNKYIPVSCGIIVMLLALALAPIPPTKAQFVIATYTYDTNNDGNYIAIISMYRDSVHNGTMYYNPVSYPNDTAIQPLEISETEVNLTLYVSCWLNSTSAGVSSLAEGLAIIRHNVTVTSNNGTIVFSQQNFTNTASTDGGAPMYYYVYGVYLDFTLISGAIYTVIVIYEVFY